MRVELMLFVVYVYHLIPDLSVM